jgi:deoxyribodipyrimidine photo-lyase
MNLLLFDIGNLRINDNYLLREINKNNNSNIYIFIWDSIWEEKSNNFINMGTFKKKFLKESLIDLKNNLQKINLNLNVFYGNKQNILNEIIKNYNIKNIFKNEPITDYDKQLDTDLKKSKINLIYPNLKYNYLVNSYFNTISNNKSVILKNNININDIDIPECTNNIIGGETSATFYLKNFIKKYIIYNDNNNINFYFLINNWLSFGCITNKIIYKYISNINIKNKNVNNFIKDIVLKEYYITNFNQINFNFNDNNNLNGSLLTINKLINSQTGYPYIDAIIKEINITGRTHTKNKFILASFIINDLNLNWKIGFDYFNSLLTDINYQLNLQIWYYVISKKSYYNIKKQFLELDKDCKFVKKWIQQLSSYTNKEILDNNINYFEPIIHITYTKSN